MAAVRARCLQPRLIETFLRPQGSHWGTHALVRAALSSVSIYFSRKAVRMRDFNLRAGEEEVRYKVPRPSGFLAPCSDVFVLS